MTFSQALYVSPHHTGCRNFEPYNERNRRNTAESDMAGKLTAMTIFLAALNILGQLPSLSHLRKNLAQFSVQRSLRPGPGQNPVGSRLHRQCDMPRPPLCCKHQKW